MKERLERTQNLYRELTFREMVAKVRYGLQCDPESGDYKWARFQVQRLAGPATGILANILLVLLLVYVFVPRLTTEPPPPTVTMIEESPVADPPELTPPDVPDPPTVDDAAATVSDDAVAEFVSADAAPPPSVMATPVNSRVVPIMASTRPVLTGLLGDGLLGRGEDERRKRSEIFGEPPGADAAILRALRWLKDNQLNDGSWDHGAKAPAGMTGLALLCFLAHGETLQSEEFGPTVEKAIKYLIAQVGPDGQIKGSGAHQSYGHAIATYALAEAYSMTKVVSLRDPVRRAADVIIQGQQAGGGWDYHYKHGTRADTSVMGWQAQALKAVKVAGLYSDELDAALDKSVAAFVAHQAPSGHFGYTSTGGQPMTGIAVLSLQMVGEYNHVAVRNGLAAMRAETMNWQAPSHKHALYQWYYITQAKFQAGGSDWDSWNPRFAQVLMGAQAKDGHWDAPGSESVRGPVYSTTLSTLMLCVYFRYLPSNLVTPQGESSSDLTFSENEIVPVIF